MQRGLVSVLAGNTVELLELPKAHSYRTYGETYGDTTFCSVGGDNGWDVCNDAGQTAEH